MICRISLVLLFLTLPLLGDQNSSEELNWQATAGGGSDHATNGTYVLSSTIGQVSAGAGDNGTYVLNLGYQQSFITSGEYVCGDADGDGVCNVSDAVYMIQYIFAEGPPPEPLASADTDCADGLNLSDVIYIIQYIFAGGPYPCDPDGDGTPDC